MKELVAVLVVVAAAAGILAFTTRPKCIVRPRLRNGVRWLRLLSANLIAIYSANSVKTAGVKPPWRHDAGAQYLSFCGALSHSRQAATPTPRSASLALASWALSSSAERFRLSRRKIAALA
jgi:hypothetical protein